jgi:hypothetical protein
MSKSTFFLRSQVVAPATQARAVEEIDLGAYVNLGSTKPQVLRIHSIQVQFTDDEGLVPVVDAATTTADAKSAFAVAALTTKEMVLASPNMPFLSSDDTVYSAAIVSSNLNDDKDQGITSMATDLAPQHLVNGYLVGVDTLYLYGIADDAWDESIYISICMECSVEPATRENAINLALSQA